ncbi:cytochrome c family protein [Massilia forsythiae]|uniref:Cytochrome c family protein n=1 Tax=Massilia forsythiae TaxID=2728020 RepID=A0A7Z2W1B9_9BURK|nr:cytochrome c family protein [Massilia forsythiae]QJE02970.1 cytochrome c family protein [Massilia forsythiae]
MNRLRLPTFLLFVSFLPALQACSSSADGPVDGAKAFQKCASCHQVGPNARGGFGPQLNGLFGRRAGSSADFIYSDAMKRSGIVWDERSLAAFLRDPSKVVPGTRMRFWGIGDERELAALLAHLRGFQQAGDGADDGADARRPAIRLPK